MPRADLNQFQNALQLVVSHCELAIYTIRSDDPARHDVKEAMIAARRLIEMSDEIAYELDVLAVQNAYLLQPPAFAGGDRLGLATG